jgi:thiamine biosynthesis lipoprotein
VHSTISLTLLLKMQGPSILEFDALGTHWWITFYNESELLHSQESVLLRIRSFEQDYSRFLPSSYISQLNDTKILSGPGKELVNILRSTLKFYDKTLGLFNISVGAQLEKLGYGRQHDRRAKISQSLHQDLIVNHDKITLSDTTRIDLGGIGKGWVIDQLAILLRISAPSGFIINGGGDIFASTNESQEFALEHPINSEQFIGTIKLSYAALAVSSPFKRTWIKNDQKQTHIAHPNSKLSSQYVSAYIHAKTTVEADVLATVLLIATDEERTEIMKNYSAEYLLVKNNMTYITSKNFSGTLHT